MALIDKLLDRAADEVKDPRWVERAVRQGKNQSAALGDFKPVADAALDELLVHKDAVAEVSGATFVGIVSYLALGKDNEAKMLYLRTDASFGELMGALDQASETTRAEKKAREESWQKVKAVGQKILKKAGQAAIPLLLAAI